MAKTAGIQALDADPLIDETSPSTDDIKEAVAKLRSGQAVGICYISVELLKAGCETMMLGLYGVLTAVWYLYTILPAWK